MTATFRKRALLRQSVLCIAPVIVVLLAIRGYPIVAAVYRSFTNWNGLFRNDWVGLANYKKLLANGLFWTLLSNNLILLVVVPLQVFIGLVVGLLLHEKAWGWRFFRSLYYIPQIISAIILGFLFKTFFGYTGPVNAILGKIGLSSLAIEWFGNRFTALGVIIFVLVWFSVGWQAIVIIGGLSSIPDSVFEAALLDGAGFWRRTFSIAVPMLSRVLEYSFVLSVVWTFTGLFPFIFSMTKGGPGYQTTTLDYMIYLKSFVTGTDLGEACAISVLLLIIVLVITVAEMKITDKIEDWS
jgi:ABC-type sugar transport system permease subunit